MRENWANKLMLIGVITLRFNAALDGFDDSEVAAFIANKEVISISDYFFQTDEVPYLTLVIRYRLAGASVGGEKSGKKERDDSWKGVLSDNDWPLFNSLRDWRNTYAKEKGFPSYIICTNRELAEIAHQRPQSLNALGQIEGIGEAKLKKYGKSLLELLVVGKAQEGGSGSA